MPNGGHSRRDNGEDYRRPHCNQRPHRWADPCAIRGPGVSNVSTPDAGSERCPQPRTLSSRAPMDSRGRELGSWGIDEPDRDRSRNKKRRTCVTTPSRFVRTAPHRADAVSVDIVCQAFGVRKACMPAPRLRHPTFCRNPLSSHGTGGGRSRRPRPSCRSDRCGPQRRRLTAGIPTVGPFPPDTHRVADAPLSPPASYRPISRRRRHQLVQLRSRAERSLPSDLPDQNPPT